MSVESLRVCDKNKGWETDDCYNFVISFFQINSIEGLLHALQVRKSVTTEIKINTFWLIEISTDDILYFFLTKKLYIFKIDRL